MNHVVIIGAGQAGFSVSSKLRSEGFDGRITLIGDEPHLPYQRPPLSKDFLLGKSPLERLYLRPQKYYSVQKIDVLTGEKVSAVDTDTKSVALSDRCLTYDSLVFTTGADPRHLPPDIGGELNGVFSVRTLADINRLSPEIQSDRKIAIIGGGYIGLEAAAIAAQKGMNVTLIEAAERILQRVACKETSDYVRSLHRKHGVRIIERASVASLIEDSGQVAGVQLSDGNVVDANCVIVGIGVNPATQVAEAAGLAVENGIRTNELGQTNVSNVWAAGDCASFVWRGTRLRLESVPNAIDHAEAVAKNILGAKVPYQPKPWFWSDQYDVKMQIAGLNTGYDDVVIRDVNDKRSHWYFQDKVLTAVDSFSDPASHMIARKLLADRIPVEKSTVGDPTTNLKALLK